MTSPKLLHNIYRWFAGSLPAFLEPDGRRRMSDLPLHLVDDVSAPNIPSRIPHNDNRPVRPMHSWQAK